MDTNHLARSLQQLPQVCPDLHSLLVVRHGRLIVERYFGGSQPQDAWNVKSVTKSMLSALVGIALERGYIRSLDQPVLDFFPEYRDEVAFLRVWVDRLRAKLGDAGQQPNVIRPYLDVGYILNATHTPRD